MSDPVEEIRERLNVAKPLGANHVAFLLAEVDRLREDKGRLSEMLGMLSEGLREDLVKEYNEKIAVRQQSEKDGE